MSKGKGKEFETQLRDAFRRSYPHCYAERNVDRMIGKGRISVPSPPDLIVNTPFKDYLIECKAHKGVSLPHMIDGKPNVKVHQRDYLLRYDAMGSRHVGMLAVLFYNGKRGNARQYDAHLVPIHYYMSYIATRPRKSLAQTDLRRDLRGFELEWVPGVGFNLPRGI